MLPTYEGLAALPAECLFEELLRAIADPSMASLGALDYVASCETATPIDDRPQRVIFAGTRRDGAPADFSEGFCRVWCESDADKHIGRELQRKLASVSYSAFSWPYPVRTELTASERLYYGLPKSYALFMPFSSSMVVGLKSEISFTGYLGMLFDEFPELKDERVQLVISLPTMISETVSAYYRHSIRRPSECLGDLAHEIKRYLLKADDLASNAAATEAAVREQTLSSFKRQTKRLLLVVNTRLLVDRDTAGDLRASPMKLSLNELIEESCAEFEQMFSANNSRLCREFSPDLPQLFIDPALFPMVISNLLDNTLKYSPQGGDVIVRTGIVSKSVVIEVLDQGIGVPPSEREMIFERFRRGGNASSYPGDGLGLYLVRRIVAVHGGSVCCAAGDSGETVFRVELPL